MFTRHTTVAPIFRILQHVLIVFALSHCVSPAIAAGPNIIMVFIDDMGWGDFSCFGNKAVETQNIDRLASEGIRFEQFYVNSPICSPSRVALSTGQYPQRWKITSFLSNRKHNEERGVAQWLDPQAPMLARFLHNAGYRTGHFGKWHMGGQRDVGEAPLITSYGFDASLTNFEGLGPRVLAIKDAHDGSPVKRHTLGSDKLGDPSEITYVDRALVTQSFTNAALDFVKQARADGKPFYINIWPDDVHSPFFPPQARRGDGTKRQLYHGVLDTMDVQLGVMFDYVRNQESLRSNTLILVCSDNGPEMGAGSAGHLRGFKTHLLEGGIRSPLIVWGPGFITEDLRGTVNSKSYFAAIDILPSLLEIADVDAANVSFDGETMTETLLGRSSRSRQQPIFFRRPPDRDSFYGIANCPDLAIREGNWKLLCEYDGSDALLFNLAEDPGETQNVATQRPDLAKSLTDKVVAWHLSMPADNGATYGKSK